MDDTRPRKHRYVADDTLVGIKEDVTSRIVIIRSGVDTSAEALAALRKKIKFLGFIKNMHIKTGFRKWKEQVFGTGGDPRMAYMLTNQREELRASLIEP